MHFFLQFTTGDTEFSLNLKTYLQSAVSTQVCHLYALDMKNYQRLVVRRNPKTVDMIRKHAETKLHSRVNHLHLETKIPLLKALLSRLQKLGQPPPKRKDTKLTTMPSAHDIVPKRGPLVDMFGPGTVFYRNRQREKAKRQIENKLNHFRGMIFCF